MILPNMFLKPTRATKFRRVVGEISPNQISPEGVLWLMSGYSEMRFIATSTPHHV